MIKNSNFPPNGQADNTQNSKLKFFIQKIKNLFHLTKAIVANVFYRFPSKKLKVIGVTGTDGKTTTAHLIYHILKSAGKKVSMISTIYAKVGNQVFETGLHTTTPSAFKVQKLLRQAVANGDEYFVLETTSHALDQKRVWGINFQIGVITNVTREHLDYHVTYENYLNTKIKLLLMSKIAVVNEEDQSYPYIINKIKKQELKIKNYNSNLKILNNFQELTPFNRQNYAAAYTVCRLLGLSEKEMVEGMKSFRLPKGRLDIVYDKDFKVIIDFAHTPNAFSVLLPEIRRKYLDKNSGRLIHVFGCAGLRDFYKRPEMGKISAFFSDVIILTEEDYRQEDLNEIFKQIEKGIVQSKKKNLKKLTVLKIKDRQEAINRAISIVRKGDVILITGKSHEKSLCRGSIEYPWNEYDAVIQALKKYRS